MYKGVIYKITHRDTQRVYIGQTRNLQKRIWQHKTNANIPNSNNEGQAIVKAIRECGFDAFDVSIVYESEVFEDIKSYNAHMDAMEIHFIEYYDSIEKGFNITKGGRGRKGQPLSKDHIRKMVDARSNIPYPEHQKKAVSLAAKKKWEDEEYRKKMSERMSGEKNPMFGVRLTGESNPRYGVHLSEETKMKLSIANKGRKHGPMSEERKETLRQLHAGVPKSEEHKKKISQTLLGRPNKACWKTILQYSLDGNFIKEWDSITEAQEYYHTKHISACATGKRNNAAGYYWTYKTKERIPKKVNVPKPKGNRRIAQIDEDGRTIREFETIREASRELGLNYSGISSVLQGLQKKTGGSYRFVYIE